MGVEACLERIQKAMEEEDLEIFGSVLLFLTTGIVSLFMKLKLKLVLINDSSSILQNANVMKEEGHPIWNKFGFSSLFLSFKQII